MGLFPDFFWSLPPGEPIDRSNDGLSAFVDMHVLDRNFLLAFPTKAGKPQTTGDKVLVVVVFAIGALASFVNWYLMDPDFFGR